MNDQQFDYFIKRFDVVLDQRLSTFEDSLMTKLDARFTAIENNIDWMMSALDTDEKERQALGYNFDRKHNNHERRITALKLARKSS